MRKKLTCHSLPQLAKDCKPFVRSVANMTLSNESNLIDHPPYTDDWEYLQNLKCPERIKVF